MKKYIVLSFLMVFNLCFSFGQNKVVKDFKLRNVDGKYISLSDYKSAKGFIIIFTCNHCPFAKLYPPRFNELHSKFLPNGVPLIAISSTDTVQYEEDTYPLMVEKSNNEHFMFPYLMDGNQKVAKNFNAQKTPHAYVIWNENGKWVVKYDGAFDDNGQEPEKVENKYVEAAVESLLENKKIEITQTKSIGCQIYFRKK